MGERAVVYFLVVKSISFSEGLNPPSAAFSHVQASGEGGVVSQLLPSRSLERGRHVPAGRTPQAHGSAGFWFSVLARSQVHWPAGRARQEQRAPSTLFSVVDLAQVQWRADCLPHEQVACLAVPGGEVCQR